MSAPSCECSEKEERSPMPSPHEVESFCCHYAANGNATQAYVEAIPRAATWKRRSASRKAVERMKQPGVLARIEALQELMKQTSEASFIAHLEEYFRRHRADT
jgi:hypothetical protein